MKVFVNVIFLLCGFCITSYAQEITEVNQKVDDNLFASYHILKDKPDVKWGPYLLYTRKKKMAVATGVYKNNQQDGNWRFFDNMGNLLQVYDFSASKLKYEAPEQPGGMVTYMFDVPFKSTDTLTKPIRVGGRYFGYLTYARLFIAPKWFRNSDPSRVTVELLISPGGRLAEFNFHLAGRVIDDYNVQTVEDVLKVNLNALAEEDKIFIPATKNSEPVASRIIIKAQLSRGGKLILYGE